MGYSNKVNSKIVDLKNGKYELRVETPVDADGVRHQRSKRVKAANRSIAERKLREFMATVLDEEPATKKERDSRKMPVSALLDLFIEDMTLSGKSAKTLENYKLAKAKLFDLLGKAGVKENKTAVVNADDEAGKTMLEHAQCRHLTYGIENKASLQATNVEVLASGANFTLTEEFLGKLDLQLHITGIFNVYNVISRVSSMSIMSWPLWALPSQRRLTLQ